jgi:hypothetical protein
VQVTPHHPEFLPGPGDPPATTALYPCRSIFCAAHLGGAPGEGGDNGDSRDVPDGAKLHLSGFGDDGLHVTDVWESEQVFNAFMEHRLAPAIQEIGIQGQPEVKFFPLHGVFAPALGRTSKCPISE